MSQLNHALAHLAFLLELILMCLSLNFISLLLLFEQFLLQKVVVPLILNFSALFVVFLINLLGEFLFDQFALFDCFLFTLLFFLLELVHVLLHQLRPVFLLRVQVAQGFGCGRRMGF